MLPIEATMLAVVIVLMTLRKLDPPGEDSGKDMLFTANASSHTPTRGQCMAEHHDQ